MDIQTIQEIGNIIQSLGSESKSAFIWYLIISYVRTLTIVGLICLVPIKVSKNVVKAIEAVGNVS